MMDSEFERGNLPNENLDQDNHFKHVFWVEGFITPSEGVRDLG